MILFVMLAIVFAVLLHFTPVRPRDLRDRALERGRAVLGRQGRAHEVHPLRAERVISALAGIYYTLRFGSARGDNATGLELSVIAAVLLGGVSIFGGRGNIAGVIAGVLLIGILGSALRLANVTSDVINIITGALLVASVVSTSVLAWIRRKRIGAGSKKGPPSPAQD